MPSGGTQPSLPPPPPQIKHVWGRALLTLSSHSAAPHHHQPRGNTNSAVGGHSVGTEPSPTPGTDGDGALAAQSGDVWCHSADGKGWVWGNRSECQHQHCAQRSAGTTPKLRGKPTLLGQRTHSASKWLLLVHSHCFALLRYTQTSPACSAISCAGKVPSLEHSPAWQRWARSPELL